MTPPTPPAPDPRRHAEDRAVLAVVGAITFAVVASGFAAGGVAAGLLLLALVVLLVGLGATFLRSTHWAWVTGRTAAGVVAAGAVFGLLLGGLAAPRAPLQPASSTDPATPPTPVTSFTPSSGPTAP